MKIAIILSRIPWPLEKGDKLRAYHQIKELSKTNEIYLYCLSTNDIPQDAATSLDRFCKEIHFFKISHLNIALNLLWSLLMGLPMQVGYFHHFRSRRRISRLINSLRPDHVYVQLLRTAEYAKYLDFPKTIDYQDVFSTGLLRRAKKARFLKKAVIKMEYRRVRNYESRIFKWFDNHTIISDTDRQLMPVPDKEKIHIISNGVDQDFFKPNGSSKKYDILFSGNMAYHPNITAALFLIEEILPLVKMKKPDVKLVIAGANPTARLRELASENITVTGWVEDIREFYNESKVFVAPMLTGTGLQNKLLEAMAMNLPCITTSLANMALGGDHLHNLIISDDKKEIANQIINLLDNQELSQNLVSNANAFVTENFSWERSCSNLLDILKK